jgi:hypothetical protein
MKNRLSKTVIGAALLALCTLSPSSAQKAIDVQTQIDLVLAVNAACGTVDNNRLKLIVDASTSIDCDTTGGGTTLALCACDGATLRAANLAAATEDLAAYVLITVADQQSITASGAGNDVTLVAADDVLMTPGDDFVVTPTAGSSFINGVGAGQDVSLVAADDVFLTPTDALTAAVGGAASIVTTAGAVTITAGGTTQDVGINSIDDIVLTPTDDLTIAAADIVAGAATTIAFDAAASTDELGIAENSVSIGASVAFRIVGSAAVPVACAAGTKGTIYYDTDINKMCVCNGTNYVLMNDDSTTTGCS